MPIFRFKEVTPRVKTRLDLGDQIIQAARALMAMGAGNQLDDIQRTGGRSFYLWGAVQGHQNYAWDRPLRSGAVTVAFGSGTCQDQAAVVYTILRSRLANTEVTSLINHKGIGHMFATIGEPVVDPKDEVVVVDPWPINPQAVLWEDHWCYGSTENLVDVNKGFYKMRTKAGGKNPNYLARLNKHAPNDANQIANNLVVNAQFINNLVNDRNLRKQQHVWTHRHPVMATNGDGVTMVYRVRPVWVNDNQRANCTRCNKGFTMLTRRHHCRRCGEIFCSTCTSRESRVGVPATKPGDPLVSVTSGVVRVCIPCDNQIVSDGFGA